MKKVLIAILAVVALASCQQEDAPQGVKYPILFGSTDTRAVADLADLKDNGFKVYAYFQGTAEGTGSSTFEKKVTYSEDNKVWTYEGLEYWLPGVNYYFKAFYPAQLTAGTLAVNNGSSTQSFTITNFDITKQEDVMVAEATALVPNGATCPTGGSVVNLDFQHLLACVVIELKSDIDDVMVERVTLQEVSDRETCNAGSWSSSSNQTASLYYEEDTALTEELKDITGGGFLVIPEQRDITLIIETTQKDYEVELSIHWLPGKKYTYTAEIKQNDIVFADAPGVAVWDSESATGSVIIK